MLRTAMMAGLIMGGGWWIRAQGLDPAAGAAAPLETGSYWMPLVLLFALLLGSSFSSASETALFSLDKLDQTQIKSSVGWPDRFIRRLLGRPNDTLVTILILNNIFNISISLTAAALMERLLPGGSALAFVLAAVVASTGILLFGEILPKIVAHLNPQRAARLLAPPMSLVDLLMTPFRFCIGLVLKGLFRLLHIPESTGSDEVSEEELKVMINSGEVSSVLEDDEREMIDGVFDLRRTVAAEILTPRMAVTAVPDDLSQEAMIARLKQNANNRVLVYHGTLDHLVGFMLVKEVLLDESGHWRTHLREATMVPEGVGLLDLLTTFRRERTKMAVVVDEYGGVAGIVTLQDLLQEIVGDIYEKHEHAPREIQPLAEGRWRVAGTVNLEQLGEECAVEFPEHRGRTVGGFVMNTLGRIPEPGDDLLFDGLHFRVEAMAGRRLHSLIVERAPEGETAGAREGRA